jgi:hypothetical protein
MHAHHGCDTDDQQIKPPQKRGRCSVALNRVSGYAETAIRGKVLRKLMWQFWIIVVIATYAFIAGMMFVDMRHPVPDPFVEAVVRKAVGVTGAAVILFVVGVVFYLIRYFGGLVIRASGINHMTSNKIVPPEGNWIAGWGCFDSYIVRRVILSGAVTLVLATAFALMIHYRRVNNAGEIYGLLTFATNKCGTGYISTDGANELLAYREVDDSQFDRAAYKGRTRGEKAYRVYDIDFCDLVIAPYGTEQSLNSFWMPRLSGVAWTGIVFQTNPSTQSDSALPPPRQENVYDRFDNTPSAIAIPLSDLPGKDPFAEVFREIDERKSAE